VEEVLKPERGKIRHFQKYEGNEVFKGRKTTQRMGFTPHLCDL